MADRLHVLGLYWDGGEPALHWRPASESVKEERHPLPASQRLSLMIHGPRMCVGYWHAPTASKRLCPGRRTLLPGERHGECIDCQQRGGGFYARTGFAGELNESANYLRREPHVAYLSLFGSDLVKVGVATERRKVSRVLEQGASAALFFAAGDGDTMRGLEAEVVMRTGIPDKVRQSTKLDSIWNQPDLETAEAMLRLWLERVRRACSATYRSSLLEAPEFAYNVPRFRLNAQVITSNRFAWIHHLFPGDVIAGQLAGVLGTLMFLQADDEVVYAIDGRTLQGHMAEHSSLAQISLAGPIQHVSRPMVQDALF
jgi:hypothetical protein